MMSSTEIGLNRKVFEFGDKKFNKVKDLQQDEISKVILVKCVESHFPCIIQIIDKSKLTIHERIFLHREIKVIKTLDHPNLIKLYDYKDTNLCLYLLMEYAPNGNIAQNLQKNGKFSEEVATIIFHDIVSGIQHLHSNGISHRNLKLENILLDFENNIKISEFGFINSLKKKNQSRSCICNHIYSAPEILLKLPYDGQKADVYSLGLILQELVSDDQNESKLFENCKNLITELKRVYPDDRPSLSTVLKHKWFKKPSKDVEEVDEAKEKSIPEKILECAVEKISDDLLSTIYKKFISCYNACKKGLNFK